MKGRFKFFNRRRGFGFITGEDGCEYFTAYAFMEEDTVRQIKRMSREELDEKEVSFEIQDAERGPVACRLIFS